MKKVTLFFLLTGLSLGLCAAGHRYSFAFVLNGNASGRVLIFFPFRVYYEAAAGVILRAETDEKGNTIFTSEGIDRTGYVLRTLGFSGKSLAVITADNDYEAGAAFAARRYAEWRAAVPEYAKHIKSWHNYPHRLVNPPPSLIRFERRDNGVHHHCTGELAVQYRYQPAQLGMFFFIYPMLTEMARFFDFPFLPHGVTDPAALPTEWNSEWIDLSRRLNTIGAITEKIVKKAVEFEQKEPFQVKFRVSAADAEQIEITGEAYPNVAVWKELTVRKFTRQVRLRRADGVLLSDDLFLEMRNPKGQGGYGRILLKLID